MLLTIVVAITIALGASMALMGYEMYKGLWG